MKHIITTLFLFTILHAGGSMPDALFATVVGVKDNDTLNVRAQVDYHSRKLGAFPNEAVVYVDRCLIRGRSRWCHIQPNALVGYGGVAGWVNAKFLALSGEGYVTIKERKNNCYFSLKCRNGRCLVVTELLGSGTKVTGLEKEWIPRKSLTPTDRFGAQSEGEEGYCTSDHYIEDFLRRHTNNTSPSTIADRILHAIQVHAYTKLSTLIHPIDGVILTEMVSFADTHRIHLSRSTFQQAFKSGKVFYWGDTYGRGDPIRMNLATYFKHLTLRLAPSKVKTFPASEKHFPLKSLHPRRGFEYYWIKSHSKTKEYDWRGLVVILEQYHGHWYLIGVMRDRWTI